LSDLTALNLTTVRICCRSLRECWAAAMTAGPERAIVRVPNRRLMRLSLSTFATWLRHIHEARSASSCLRELCHEEDAARFVALGDSRALPTRLTSPGLSGRTDTPIAQDETQFLPLVSRENKGEITMPGRRDPPSTQAHSWRPAPIFLRRRRQPLRLGRHRRLLRSFPRCARRLSHRRSKR
jgi:hypothetical protein